MQDANINSKVEEDLQKDSSDSSTPHDGTVSNKISTETSEPDNNSSRNADENIYQRVHSYLKEKFCTETEVIGVEIQPDIIRICQAKNELGKWHMVKIASSNVLNTYNYESLSKNKKIYVKCLKEIFKDNKINNKNIALSIPASMAIIKIISLPLMTEENLKRATKIESFWKNLVQLSGDSKDYDIYYKIVDENPESKEMDILFVACKNEDLDVYRNIAEEAGLNVVVADIGCFSINNLSKLKESKSDKTEVYLKIGKDENYLQVLENDKPYIYDIFVPENEKAYLNEYLEHQTFQQRFNSQLKHVITKHEDKYKSKISEISVISDERKIQEFTKSLNKNLDNIKVTQSNLFENIKLPKTVEENKEFKENNSAWAVAAGLATRNIQIFEDEDKKSISESINLLPEASTIKEKLKAAFYSKIIVGCISLSSIICIMLFGIYSYGKYQHSTVEIKEFNKLNSHYMEKQKLFNEISEASKVLNKLILLRGELNSNQKVIIDAFQEIAKSIPEGVWLEEVKIDKNSQLEIQGRSFGEKNIINFSKMFESSKNILDVNIGSMKSIYSENGVMMKEFIINGKLRD